MGGVPLDWVLKLRELKMKELATEIVEHCLDELAGRAGLDIGEIVQDDEIEKDIRDTMIERVEAVLRKRYDLG